MIEKSPLIQLEGITKFYGDFKALDRVSLKIDAGVTGLLGPNGAGKSTLIKVLLGLLTTSEGRGEVLGYDLARDSQEIRANVGYLPEDDCILPGLSGIESVQFSARLSRIPPTEALRRAHEILDFCGMGQERYRLVETYSTGMRQKLRFAQSIVHDPPILILDEPTSGLDPQERDATLNRIRLLARDHGKSVLLCTHILPDVQAVSDAVVILANGRVKVADRLEQLSRSPSPGMHLRLLGDAAAFERAISRSRCTMEQGENGTFIVRGNQDEMEQAVWAAARESGVAIRSMIPTRTSLEEIFLRALREQPRGTETIESEPVVLQENDFL